MSNLKVNDLSSARSQESFTRVEIDRATQTLRELHRQVIGRTGRIELMDEKGSVCVLLCKSELDALEQALEILSDTHEVRAMSDQLSRLVADDRESVSEQPTAVDQKIPSISFPAA